MDDGHGGAATKTVVVTITGSADTTTNHAPVVSGAVTGTTTEDALSMLDALANASDMDPGTTLSVVNVPASLPAGVSYDAPTHPFALDPSNAAFQHLAQGETATVTVNYGVSDGLATTPATVSWTVTGTNDGAVLSSATIDLAETDAPLTTGGTLTNSDVDSSATFVAQAGTAGSHGTFAIGTAGAWTYTATRHTTSSLPARPIPTRSCRRADGTLTSVTVNIHGTNDAAVLSSARSTSPRPMRRSPPAAR